MLDTFVDFREILKLESSCLSVNKNGISKCFEMFILIETLAQTKKLRIGDFIINSSQLGMR